MLNNRTRVAVQIIASIFAATAALKSLVWPYIEKSLFATPAIEIVSISMRNAIQGEEGLFTIVVNKIRPCQPKSATLYITDAAGTSHVAETSWRVPLRVALAQNPTFKWAVDRDMAPGSVTEGYLEVWESECQDGPDPSKPATIKLNQFSILGKVYGN